jgi:GNAT superfamily N-acetyltransferase
MGGASVGFMQSITHERAEQFWKMVAAGVQSGERAIVVAEDQEGICGTAQLVLAMPDNQPHRADVCKVLVHRRARRRGVGAALMEKIEDVAREEGKTLLVLDTVTNSDAYRMYERGGWVKCGDIPGYALMPDGAVCGTTYFWKDLQ